MNIILIVLHVFLSLGIITLVLLQKGAGASAGAAFGGGGGGGGGAGSVFGATGSSNFLSKTTAVFAVGFFINSLVLAYLAANRDMQVDSVLDAFISPGTEISVPADNAPLETDMIPGAAIPEAVEAGSIETNTEADLPPAAGEKLH